MEHTRRFVGQVLGADMHALRVLSLANGVAGVLHTAVLSIAAVGRAFALLNRIQAKSGIKQVDRMLSNAALDLEKLMSRWVKFVVGTTSEFTLALDWTDFHKDDHTTLCAYLVTRHGRAMPLVWRTVNKSSLKDNRTRYETELIETLHRWVSKGTRITLLADRGFGRQPIVELLQILGWDYVIRIQNQTYIHPLAKPGNTGEKLVNPNGRADKFVRAKITQNGYEVPAAVIVKRKNASEPCCLVSSFGDWTAANILALYAKRFSIEEAFRDMKDLHFGMGLSATHIKGAARRDRMLLLVAIAQSLLCLLGAAGEHCGLDRTLKTNTAKHRTMSLFHQGLFWYRAMPNLPEKRLAPLIQSYDFLLREHEFFGDIFAHKN